MKQVDLIDIKNIEKTYTLILRNEYINLNELRTYVDCLDTHITQKEILETSPNTITFNHHYLKQIDLKNKIPSLSK